MSPDKLVEEMRRLNHEQELKEAAVERLHAELIQLPGVSAAIVGANAQCFKTKAAMYRESNAPGKLQSKIHRGNMEVLFGILSEQEAEFKQALDLLEGFEVTAKAQGDQIEDLMLETSTLQDSLSGVYKLHADLSEIHDKKVATISQAQKIIHEQVVQIDGMLGSSSRPTKKDLRDLWELVARVSDVLDVFKPDRCIEYD